MYYTVYQTTNLVNNKQYIGVHKTLNPNDEYYGSGKLLKQAILKEGIHNFKKDVLFIFDNPSDAYAKERELVTAEYVQSDGTYNLIVGGIPTADWVDERVNHYRRNIKTFLGRTHTEETKEKIRHKSSLYRHSDESRAKISEGQKGRVSVWKGKSQPIEANIKRSASRLKQPKTVCEHCGFELTTQNMWRHLKAKHPEVYSTQSANTSNV